VDFGAVIGADDLGRVRDSFDHGQAGAVAARGHRVALAWRAASPGLPFRPPPACPALSPGLSPRSVEHYDANERRETPDEVVACFLRLLALNA
jgi:hypothetical protein